MDSSRPPPPRSPSPSPPSQHQQFQLEITVVSAKHLKNLNWKQGSLKPYAVVYLDQDRRVATKPDDVGATKPVWNERFVLPVPNPSLEDAVFSIEIFHSKPSETPKSPFVGAARVPLKELLPSKEKQPLHDQYRDQSQLPRSSTPVIRTLELRRSSGRPQGKVRIKVSPIMELPSHDTFPPIPPLPHTAPTASATISSVPPPPVADYSRLSSPSPNSSGCFNTNYPATAVPPQPVVPEENYSSYSSPPAPSFPTHYVITPPPSQQTAPHSRPPHTNTGPFCNAPPYPVGSSYSYPSFAGSGYYSAPPAPPRMLQQNASLPPPTPQRGSVSTRDFPSSGRPSAPLDYYAGPTTYFQYKQANNFSSVGTGLNAGAPALVGSFHGLTLEETSSLPAIYGEHRTVDVSRDMVARGGNYRDFRAGM